MPERVLKTYGGIDLQCDEGKREVVAVINTEAVDRDGEVVQPKGLKKKNYQGNPVVLVSHDYQSLPVGKALWVKASTDEAGRDVLIAKTYFSDKTETARDVFGLLQDGVLNAFSIGFVPIKASAPSTKELNARPDLKNAKLIHREWELLEYSVVGVPANPEALTLAVSKGYGREVIDFISGKNANGKAAVEQIVEAVTTEGPKKFSEAELYKAVAKKLDSITLKIDPDKVFAKAVAQLRHMAE